LLQNTLQPIIRGKIQLIEFFIQDIGDGRMMHNIQ